MPIAHPVTHPLEAGRRLSIIVPPAYSDFRLSLVSNDPVPAADQTAKTTLYLTAHTGEVIALWHGNRWRPYASPEVSLSLAALAADTVYDVFAVLAGAAINLETLAWSSATARATPLVRQDGVWVKTGDPTRRWMGTISTTPTAGQCEDSLVKRYVWNAQNRVPRPLRRIDPATQWSYTVDNVWRQANANAANEVAVVVGLFAESLEITVQVSGWHTVGGGGIRIGIGEDSTTATKVGALSGTMTASGPNVPIHSGIAIFRGLPAAIGRHRYPWLEWKNAGGSGTFLGDEAGDNNVSGLAGTVWA
jgi:hypothetical protein